LRKTSLPRFATETTDFAMEISLQAVSRRPESKEARKGRKEQGPAAHYLKSFG
jgi:hypothetical protein